MLLEKGQKIEFMGDSITDAGRRDIHAPYGDGYVSQLVKLLTARYPDYGFKFVNKGVSGDTTRNLKDRWQRDVIAEAPDWLSIMIGINDVWRFFGGNKREAVPLEEYTANMRQLLDSARQNTKAKLILMTPYMIEANPAQPMRRQMDSYGAVVQQLASEYNAVFVDTQVSFDTALATTKDSAWANDQIHPNSAGHAVIALAWLKAIGFEL